MKNKIGALAAALLLSSAMTVATAPSAQASTTGSLDCGDSGQVVITWYGYGQLWYRDHGGAWQFAETGGGEFYSGSSQVQWKIRDPNSDSPRTYARCVFFARR